MSARYWTRGVTSLPRRLLLIVAYLVVLRWLRDPVGLIRGNIEVARRREYLEDVRRGRLTHCAPRCATIRPDVYKRADPLIYSQSYLMEQGLAVTWNNPDIQIFENGNPVSSSSLKQATDYDIVATIHNNSTEAPAVGLGVEFSFQSFGVGAALAPIGAAAVNLPVKGAPGHPALAQVPWRTPDVPGHYCIKVNLLWADDANPKNNTGQENTNVGAATSPAVFGFPVRNDDSIRKAIRLTVDSYTIPRPLDCREKPKPRDSDRRYPQYRRRDVAIPTTEEAADWTYARARHAPANFSIPSNWTIDIAPQQFALDPGQDVNVAVTITPPDDFSGERSFNVNAMHGEGLLGGVTLTVTK